MQPPFIFSSFNSVSHPNSSNMSNTEVGSLVEVDTVESEREGPGYMLGVILCLFAAVADSFLNIVQITLKQHFSDINSNHLIVSCGKIKCTFEPLSTYTLL